VTTISRPHPWPGVVDLVAELRGQLDQALATNAELTAELQALRATLLGEAVIAEDEREVPERRGSAWWRAAWREVTRHRAELTRRVQQLEGWLLDGGREATQLQAELHRCREQNGELARQLAETEGDVVEANAALADALDKLACCQCGPAAEEVH
jgi:chromosome segregation ATPase